MTRKINLYRDHPFSIYSFTDRATCHLYYLKLICRQRWNVDSNISIKQKEHSPRSIVKATTINRSTLSLITPTTKGPLITRPPVDDTESTTDTLPVLRGIGESTTTGDRCQHKLGHKGDDCRRLPTLPHAISSWTRVPGEARGADATSNRWSLPRETVLLGEYSVLWRFRIRPFDLNVMRIR